MMSTWANTQEAERLLIVGQVSERAKALLFQCDGSIPFVGDLSLQEDDMDIFAVILPHGHFEDGPYQYLYTVFLGHQFCSGADDYPNEEPYLLYRFHPDIRQSSLFMPDEL